MSRTWLVILAVAVVVVVLVSGCAKREQPAPPPVANMPAPGGNVAAPTAAEITAGPGEPPLADLMDTAFRAHVSMRKAVKAQDWTKAAQTAEELSGAYDKVKLYSTDPDFQTGATDVQDALAAAKQAADTKAADAAATFEAVSGKCAACHKKFRTR
jgi:hypothetical protein